ncbi:hypothetical protein [Mesorhizobium sp.]|uniref:hypothetical protein n=1 Tax=Mesorhizobium sp. TaxID=1871066 RepID=UPI000FE96883|nr:hypothetical protein [Mesorhizobium sp.]RWA78226.1 MAG: hypothetical protein EOQ30_30695 [Mesorhizobium sp.]
MTKFFKSILAAQFKDKLDRLRRAFQAACDPFQKEIADLQKQHDAFEQMVQAGEARWEEVDEDTGAGWSYGEDLAERREDAEDALLTIRKAFVTTTYHLWERGAQRWGKMVGKPNHTDLIKALNTASVAVDEKRLEELRLLVNCLKHNSSSARELHKSRPSLFVADFDPDALHPATGKLFSHIDWADNVVLTDSDVDTYFEVVLSSAPK